MASDPSTTDLQGNQSHGIVAANLVVAILATIAVALRLIARKIQRLQLQADDYMIVLALPFGWGSCITTLIAVHYGLGKHIATLTPALLATEGKAFLASELLWATALPIIKISILLLYVRIFGRLRYMRILAYGIGIFSILWGIMVVLVCSFQCRPVQFIWDKSIKGTCINAPIYFIAGSAPDVFTDFMVLALPWHAVWQLKLSTPQKVSLVGIFSLGSLTCIIGLVRLINLIQKRGPDVTWLLGSLGIWSTAEPCLGIVSACLPTLGPLVRKMLPQRTTRGPSDDSSGRKPLNAESKPSFNRHGSSMYNQLGDDFAKNSTVETQIISLNSSRPDQSANGVPVDAIKVETSTNLSSRHA